MVAEMMSGMVQGIQGELITVQTDISDGLPVFYMVGHLAPEVREAKERVRTALKNAGFCLPPKRISVNLAPAGIRKEGTYYDLSIAVGLFAASGLLPEGAGKDTIFLGELALDGTLSPLTGVLPILKKAAESGYRQCVIPVGNAEEAAVLPGMNVLSFFHLKEVFTYLTTGRAAYDKEKNMLKNITEKRTPGVWEAGKRNVEAWQSAREDRRKRYPDLSEVKGQKMAKRALEIAVAGYHNLFLDGPPGTGKSMLASCVPGIMPEMSQEEKIDATIIYSVKGLLKDGFALVKERPFRAPSRLTTVAGMFGGGNVPKPGEISLAHRGVLFLDEFPEFKKELIEMFRVPLEQHQITQIRNGKTITFPADFILIAAANPCPCGYYPDREHCRCSWRQIINYQNKLSGPVLDRLDLFVRCDRISYRVLTEEEKGETSSEIKEKICRVWEIQKERFKNTEIRFNGRMGQKEIAKYCRLDGRPQNFMKQVFDVFHMSGRAYFRVLKTARTIADLADSENIREEHLKEAMLFRRTAPKSGGFAENSIYNKEG